MMDGRTDDDGRTDGCTDRETTLRRSRRLLVCLFVCLFVCSRRLFASLPSLVLLSSFPSLPSFPSFPSFPSLVLFASLLASLVLFASFPSLSASLLVVCLSACGCWLAVLPLGGLLLSRVVCLALSRVVSRCLSLAVCLLLSLARMDGVCVFWFACLRLWLLLLFLPRLVMRCVVLWRVSLVSLLVQLHSHTARGGLSRGALQCSCDVSFPL